MLSFDRSLGTVLCAASLLAACAKDAKPSASDAGTSANDAGAIPTARFVGAVEDSDALVAIVQGGTNLRLFFCGGQSSVENGTQWFNLDMQDMKDADVMITTPWQVSAHVASDGVTGQVTRDDGIARDFSAAPIAHETLAGLYEGSGDCGRLGLIVSQPDQSAEIVAQGACVGDGHLPEQVNPILPVALNKGTILVQVPGGSADETTQLMAATLQPL